MIHTFCVAHQRIKFELPASAHLVWLGNTPPPPDVSCHVIQAAEFAPELNAKHAQLSGAAGSYVVRKYLAQNPGLCGAGARVAMIQYRKIISTQPLGIPAANYAGCQILYPDEAAVVDIERILDLADGAYLLSQIVWIGGILQQYAYGHYVEDFLRYSAIAVELGVLSRDEVTGFFGQGIMIPGGVEFGILPVDTFMEIIQKLERVCFAFLAQHKAVSEDPYQSRALAFCNERLGSYLLLKRLTSDFRCAVPELPRNFFGYMHTVVEPGERSI